MSQDGRHLLFPRPSSFVPTPQAVASPVGALVREGCIEEAGDCHASGRGAGKKSLRTPLPVPVTSEWLAERAEQDLHLSWEMTIGDPREKDLFVRDEYRWVEVEYSLSFEIAGRDLGYIHRVGECVGAFDGTACACGAELAFDLATIDVHSDLGPSRLHTRCPRCARPFEVSTLSASYRRLPGKEHLAGRPAAGPLMGGATSRFAIVIECGEDAPGYECGHMPALRPELLEMCSQTIGCPFYEVWDDNC